jgi:fructose-bisphosphate aldolase, class I
MIDTSKILKNGRGLILAYDHGFEYGPTDFNENSVDPERIIEIAESGYFTGFVCHKGIAAKYYDPKINKVPLILKLNAKTAHHKKENPIALQSCSVDEAIRLGATAISYTIYVGSEHEEIMIQEFGKIEDEAHRKGIIVFAGMYSEKKEILAYAARIGMELNADAISLKYTGDPKSFEWVIKNAGKTKVFIIGGPRTDTAYQLIETAKAATSVGGAGLTIGRNIWQAKHPLEVGKQLASVIYGEV